MLIPIILDLSYKEPITKILFYAAGVALSMAGILLAGLNRDKSYWIDFWRHILNFRQISGKWYLFIFSIIPITSGIAVSVNYIFTKTMPEFNTLKDLLQNLNQLIPFAISMLLFGPVAEEIGWRGYALDNLEKQYGWISSSIILGFFWSVWHLHMFFIKGTYQYDLMSRSLFLFIDFYVAIFAASIIMDWVYNNNHRSILSGVLVHFCINFFGELLKLPDNVFEDSCSDCYRWYNSHFLE